MVEQYKYQSYIPQYYNITTKLIDEMVEKGLGDKVAVYYQDKTYTYAAYGRAGDAGNVRFPGSHG
jgi:hypothetical protein